MYSLHSFYYLLTEIQCCNCVMFYSPCTHTDTPGLDERGHEQCPALSPQSSRGQRCLHSDLAGLCTEPSANEWLGPPTIHTSQSQVGNAFTCVLRMSASVWVVT